MGILSQKGWSCKLQEMLIYVDNLMSGNDVIMVEELKTTLHNHFKLKYLGMEVSR
jgi:hypothetical protein